MKSVSVTLLAGIVGCAFVQPDFASEGVKFPKGYTTETTVYSGFNQDGRDPAYPNPAPLTDINGMLYGTTSAGGASYDGAVFSVNATTGAETVLYSFTGGTDGWSPLSGLIPYKGLLYGTSYLGGANKSGDVYSINPGTGALKVVYSFGTVNGPDAQNPGIGNLLRVKGVVYGTTTQGGANNQGAVYSLNLKTGKESVLYSFCSQSKCADGSFPNGPLIDVNGTLYSTTSQGGASGNGTVYAINVSTGAESVVYSFCSKSNCTDGQAPVLGVLDVNGTLYGTTIYGGTNNNITCANGNYVGCGTVYSINPGTGAESVVYSFCGQENCIDGSEPQAGLIDVAGTLYGTTFEGGTYSVNGIGEGTAFGVNLATGKETVQHSFSGLDGQYPYGVLINKDKALYGISEMGGSYGFGSLFKLTK